jgi:hypothetical protein
VVTTWNSLPKGGSLRISSWVHILITTMCKALSDSGWFP